MYVPKLDTSTTIPSLNRRNLQQFPIKLFVKYFIHNHHRCPRDPNAEGPSRRHHFLNKWTRVPHNKNTNQSQLKGNICRYKLNDKRGAICWPVSICFHGLIRRGPDNNGHIYGAPWRCKNGARGRSPAAFFAAGSKCRRSPGAIGRIEGRLIQLTIKETGQKLWPCTCVCTGPSKYFGPIGNRRERWAKWSRCGWERVGNAGMKTSC